jgi:hypothetical protein
MRNRSPLPMGRRRAIIADYLKPHLLDRDAAESATDMDALHIADMPARVTALRGME